MFRKTSTKIKAELKEAFEEEHTPHQTAASFAIGVFITSLPTLGTGLLLFGVLTYFFKWINRIALFSSVLVLNPFVKPFFYVSSIALGGAIIGVGGYGPTLEPATSVLLFLIVGNLIIAAILSLVSYFLILELMKRFEEDKKHIIEEIEEITPIEKIEVN